MPAHRVPASDSESESSEDEQPRPPLTTKVAPRRGRDVSPEEGSPLPPRTRKASVKQSTKEKENLVSLEKQLAKLKKQLGMQKKKSKSYPATIDVNEDDGPESEERPSGDEDDGAVSFSSAIKPLGRLPLPAPRPTTVLRKIKKSTMPKTAAHVSAPSPAKDGDDYDMYDDQPPVSPLHTSPLSRSSSPLGSSDSRGRTAAAIVTSKRPRPTTTSSPPPTKRLKLAAQEAKFAEGYTPVAGVKPKASDYTPIPQALILRACADYSARILTVDAFPGVAVQVRWAKETFKGTCHGAKERYILTDRMAKIIMARGSQARGKMLDAYRSLFASHYGFERSSATKNIKANKLKVEKHLEKAAFHYKLARAYAAPYNIKPENLYNVDEKGFMLGVSSREHVVLFRRSELDRNMGTHPNGPTVPQGI
ncbi:hypothetical protein B0H10DRAFT_2244982 [Mycena sp. CBHHK59/15]|nr:hypothetical protein B0H10DRAFT_2244982 [Mycena sp. CBHHK59/15]